MIDWDKQPLGKMVDQELADTLNVNRATIKKHRYKRNIPPFRKHRKIK